MRVPRPGRHARFAIVSLCTLCVCGLVCICRSPANFTCARVCVHQCIFYASPPKTPNGIGKHGHNSLPSKLCNSIRPAAPHLGQRTCTQTRVVFEGTALIANVHYIRCIRLFVRGLCTRPNWMGLSPNAMPNERNIKQYRNQLNR